MAGHYSRGGDRRDLSAVGVGDHPRRSRRVASKGMTIFRYIRALVLALLVGCALAAPASAQTAPAQIIWRLLDYIAVDYAGAVSDGQVVNEAEYVEMVEFSASVRQRLGELPPSEARAGLLPGGGRPRTPHPPDGGG